MAAIYRWLLEVYLPAVRAQTLELMTPFAKQQDLFTVNIYIYIYIQVSLATYISNHSEDKLINWCIVMKWEVIVMNEGCWDEKTNWSIYDPWRSMERLLWVYWLCCFRKIYNLIASLTFSNRILDLISFILNVLYKGFPIRMLWF